MVKKIPLKEPKDAQVKKLKNKIRRLEKEISKLKSELRTYEQAFEKTERFLQDHTDEITLEDLIKAANKKQTLKEVKAEKTVKEVCKKCLSPDLKEIPTRFGKVRLCSGCGQREVINESTNSNDDGDYTQ